MVCLSPIILLALLTTAGKQMETGNFPWILGVHSLYGNKSENQCQTAGLHFFAVTCWHRCIICSEVRILNCQPFHDLLEVWIVWCQDVPSGFVETLPLGNPVVFLIPINGLARPESLLTGASVDFFCHATCFTGVRTPQHV